MCPSGVRDNPEMTCQAIGKSIKKERRIPEGMDQDQGAAFPTPVKVVQRDTLAMDQVFRV